MPSDPGEVQLILESVKFAAWLIGSICTLAVTLMGVYLRMYVREALRDHAEIIEQIVAANYVRRDVYDSDIRGLLARIEGQA